MSCWNGGKFTHAPPPSPQWTETCEVLVVAGSWNKVLGLEVDEFNFDLPERLVLKFEVNCWRCNGNGKR